MATKRIYGIDLGTTYSCIAYVDDSGRPVVIQNHAGELTTPSVVHFESADNVVVGRDAKNAAKLDPDRVAAFVKRCMGNPDWSFTVDGKAYRPEEVSAIVLRKLVGDAAQALGEEITDVVITCPAYFGVPERQATIKAGEIAGLTVRHILNEPTAAAICYGVEREGADRIVLVYDLGGGTFDITVVALEKGDIRVVYTGGDHNLGGKDWDDRIVGYFAEQFQAQHPDKGDPRDDPHTLQDLVNGAEDAKKALSQREKYPFMVTHAGERARVELTREKLEELTADLLDNTLRLTTHVLEEARKRGVVKIDQVLLVGGLTKMACVAPRLKELVKADVVSFEPDLAVAKGAALMGHRILAGEVVTEIIAAQTGAPVESVDIGNVDARTLQEAASKASKTNPSLRLPAKDLASLVTSRIVNVCSKSFGVTVVDEDGKNPHVEFLIHNNTAVPVEVTNTEFSTVFANQRKVRVEVMEQGGQMESPEPEQNKRIADGEISVDVNLPAGSPIHVTFRLEDDGTMHIRALEPSTGRDLLMETKVEGVMTQAEVEASRALLRRKTVA